MSTTRMKAFALTAVLAVVTAIACTDPTVAPKSTIAPGTFFGTDPNAYREFLAKVYGGLAVGGQQGGDGSTDIQGIDGGFSQYLRLYWELEELPTDEAVIAWGDQDLPPLNTQTWVPDNRFTTAMYYRIFFQVAMANEYLRQTVDDSLTARGVSTAMKTTIHGYRAEARFLRALSYWHGIDLFGNIPMVTEADALGATAPKQATRTQLYNYVVSELQAIKSDLPMPSDTYYGRATQASVDMLLAELYLNAGVYTGTPNYAGALSEASTVISAYGYTLAPNYFSNFNATNNTSPEMVFAVPEDGVHTQTFGSTNFLIHASCGGSMDYHTYGVDGCWYGLRMKPSAHDLYAVGDTRSNSFYTSGQSVAVTSIGNFNAGIPNPKYSNAGGSTPQFADTDYPMFRLAEAYLIYAEAEVRGGGGDTTTALSYVNALRLRAFNGDSTKMVNNSQMTLQFLLDERGRELMWEARRRSDLVRYGQFTDSTYLWAWKGKNPGGSDSVGVKTDPKFNLYPLPASELIANPNLHQNPGY